MAEPINSIPAVRNLLIQVIIALLFPDLKFFTLNPHTSPSMLETSPSKSSMVLSTADQSVMVQCAAGQLVMAQYTADQSVMVQCAADQSVTVQRAAGQLVNLVPISFIDLSITVSLFHSVSR